MSDPIKLKRRLEALQALAQRPGTEGERQAALEAIARHRAAHEALVPLNLAGEADDPLNGFHIRLDRTTDRLRPCCDEPEVGVLGAPKAQHGPSIRCAACDSFRGWMKQAAAARLRDLLDRGLVGPLMPTLRDASISRGAMPVHPDGAAWRPGA